MDGTRAAKRAYPDRPAWPQGAWRSWPFRQVVPQRPALREAAIPRPGVRGLGLYACRGPGCWRHESPNCLRQPRQRNSQHPGPWGL